MRIAVNAQLYPSGETYRSAGVARYVRELVRRLPEAGSSHEFVFFAPPSVQPLQGATRSRLPTGNPVVRIGWEQLAEPALLRHHHIDVLHSPVNVGSLASGTPSVITIHDLSFLKFPERFLPPKRWYQTVMTGASARRARRIIVPSGSTKSDVVESFRVDPDKVVVVAEGVDAEFRPDSTTDRPLADPYILFAGTLEPRKNIPMLIQAFARFKAEGRAHRLALVGAKGWMFREIERAVEESGVSDQITVPGYVTDLARWYNHADFFVYPSAYEGFGLPPLEAMACGTPVVVSPAGSLREIAGGAAILVDPFDSEGLLAAMRTVADNPDLRTDLRARGLKRASEFPWDEAARKTVQVYEDAVNDG